MSKKQNNEEYVPEEQLFKVTLIFMGGRRTIKETLAFSKDQAISIVKAELDEYEQKFVDAVICE